MAINSRDKGGRGERAVKDAWRAAGYTAVMRTPMSGAMAGFPGDLMGVPELHMEVKNVERLNIWKAIEQSERDCPEGSTPTVTFKRSRCHWYVAVPLEDFIELWKLRHPPEAS